MTSIINAINNIKHKKYNDPSIIPHLTASNHNNLTPQDMTALITYLTKGKTLSILVQQHDASNPFINSVIKNNSSISHASITLLLNTILLAYTATSYSRKIYNIPTWINTLIEQNYDLTYKHKQLILSLNTPKIYPIIITDPNLQQQDVDILLTKTIYINHIFNDITTFITIIQTRNLNFTPNTFKHFMTYAVRQLQQSTPTKSIIIKLSNFLTNYSSLIPLTQQNLAQLLNTYCNINININHENNKNDLYPIITSHFSHISFTMDLLKTLSINSQLYYLKNPSLIIPSISENDIIKIIPYTSIPVITHLLESTPLILGQPTFDAICNNKNNEIFIFLSSHITSPITTTDTNFLNACSTNREIIIKFFLDRKHVPTFEHILRLSTHNIYTTIKIINLFINYGLQLTQEIYEYLILTNIHTHKYLIIYNDTKFIQIQESLGLIKDTPFHAFKTYSHHDLQTYIKKLPSPPTIDMIKCVFRNECSSIIPYIIDTYNYTPTIDDIMLIPDNVLRYTLYKRYFH